MSITISVSTNVPESRKVVLDLPRDVPIGPATLTVTVANSDDVSKVVLVEPSVRTATVSRPEHPQLAQEYDAFQKLLPDLLRTHRGQYVAVHAGAVVASGADSDRVIREAYDLCGYQPIYLALVDDAPQRIARSGLRREVRS